MSEFFKNAEQALKDILFDGMTVMSGGFGLCGIPENAIDYIQQNGVKNLICISNNCGTDEYGLGKLLHTKQIKKMVSSYVGENKTFEQQYLTKELELELLPQGTLAEKIRAGGAGIPAFYTPTGVGTVVEEGKETKIFDNRTYILEKSLYADLAIVKAWKADRSGNIIYRKTARNFNPIMAMAAKVTFVEVEEIVEEGMLDADNIHTPCIFVDRIILGVNYVKHIEKITLL